MGYTYRVTELMDYEVADVRCSVMEEGRDCRVAEVMGCVVAEVAEVMGCVVAEVMGCVVAEQTQLV